MGILVVLAFTVPLLVGLAVVAVKTLELALNRTIASSKVVARWTTIFALGGTAVGCVVFFVWLMVKLSGDPS